jgi:hypothetical protein
MDTLSEVARSERRAHSVIAAPDAPFIGMTNWESLSVSARNHRAAFLLSARGSVACPCHLQHTVPLLPEEGIIPGPEP